MSGLLSDFLAFDAESVKVSEHDVGVRGEGAGGARGESVALAGAGDQVGVAQRVAAAQEVLRDRVGQTPAGAPGHHLHKTQYVISNKSSSIKSCISSMVLSPNKISIDLHLSH